MNKSEIELLDNELIISEQLEEIELNEDVKSVDNLGQSVFHDAEWYNVKFVDGSDIDVYVLEKEELEIDCEPNMEKVKELLQMGEVFKDLNGILDWNYISNNKIQVFTLDGTYLSELVHGTWGRLIRTDAFTM